MSDQNHRPDQHDDSAVEPSTATPVTGEQPEDPKPVGLVTEGHASASDLRDEQYERAKMDPAYARQQAIEVDEDDRGDEWDREGEPPLFGDPDDLPVHDEDESEADAPAADGTAADGVAPDHDER